MKSPEEIYRRPISLELAYVCDRLKAEEVEILGKALRRGLLEIFKAVVLHELEKGDIERQEAARLLGSKIVERALAARQAPRSRRSQRPGPRKIPRLRKT